MQSSIHHYLIFLLLPALALLLSFTACTDEEEFPTADGDRILFSTDTLQMDTVLSAQNSVVRSFSIYNRNSDGISITAVDFMDNAAGGFHVNVDGTSITGGTLPVSIDCRKDDSLQVFVDFYTPDADQDEKQLHEATLIFTLANGQKQSVVLQGYSQDVIRLKNLHVQSDLTLNARRPYLIQDSLTVEQGATLTLQPGVRLFFQPSALLRVDGTLLSNGTLSQPVVLRGERMDQMFEGQPYDRISGQWQGILISPNSFGNTLNYTDIHAGSYGILLQPTENAGTTKLTLLNSVLHNVTGNCLQSTGARIVCANSQISNAGQHCVSICGGDASFYFCTLAQFYPFSGLRGTALIFTNYSGATAWPLQNIGFQSCLITGYSDDEIEGSPGKNFPSVPFNYSFLNCLLNTVEINDDAAVQNNAWDTDKDTRREKNFSGWDLDKLLYSFQPIAKSRAAGIADATLAGTLYPADRSGISRLSDGRADAGCYECAPAE